VVHYLQPIIINNLVQIDLTDLRVDPDGKYQWILHIRDQFSKYSCAHPLKSKESVKVAMALIVWINLVHQRFFSVITVMSLG